MNKTEIREQLIFHHAAFTKMLDELSDKDFKYAPIGKWTAGQQLDHICKSTKPLILATALPGFALKLVFGKANRPSKNYEALVEKYHAKLALGGTASSPFVPAEITTSSKAMLIKQLTKTIRKIENNCRGFSEAQLDICILPHPLLGKLTLREMLYFTIYHVQHHKQLVVKYLEQKS